MVPATEMADKLAKKAAESVAITARARKWLKSRFAQAKALAIFVGQLTHEAGAHRLPTDETVRDSVGIDAAAAPNRKAKRRRKRKP